MQFAPKYSISSAGHVNHVFSQQRDAADESPQPSKRRPKREAKATRKKAKQEKQDNSEAETDPGLSDAARNVASSVPVRDATASNGQKQKEAEPAS